MGYNIKKKTGFWFICLMLVCTAVLGACSGTSSGKGEEETDQTNQTNQKPASPSNGSENGQEQNDPEPVTITMLNVYQSDTAPKPDDPTVVAVEEFTNTKLDITWVPGNVYEEKLNVTLVSGELPQVILANPLNGNIINGIESGMFWELEPYLDEFPNLKTFNHVALENSKYKGKMYSIIRPRPVARDGAIIRKDWLDHLNMELPTTTDEFYELLVAFRDNDPDQNGENDTYGLMQYDGFSRSILAWFGAPNHWKVEDGRFIKDVETAEYLEGLKFIKKLYDEGLINPGFAIEDRNVTRKDIYTNKVGVSVESFDAVVPFYYNAMAEHSDSFDFTVAAPINNRSFGGLGYYLAFMIPKKSVQTEEELKQILRFFDAQRSPEVTEQFRQLLLDNAEKPDNEQFNVDNLRQLLVNEVLVYPLGDSERDQMIREKMDANNAVAIGDPSAKYVSPTHSERGGELNTILADAAIQFVMGEIDEAGFKAAVEQWKQAGGSKVAEELAEQYKE